MADRRMFTKKVTDDDNFLTLSSSAQALYLHLSMAADDDGFCNQVSVSMFKAHASVQDLEALLDKRFLYQFENGVIVIKHWRMANALRKDRYTPTAFQEEMKKLGLKGNGAYTMDTLGCHMVATRLPDGCHSIGKDRIDKVSIDKDSKERTDTKVSARKKESTASSYESILSESGLDETVIPVVWDFIKMRKLIKAPMTDKALSLMISKLKTLNNDPEAQIAILNQSIENSWKGIFPVEQEKRKGNGRTDVAFAIIDSWGDDK